MSRKLRCTDPTGTVDIAIGKSGVEANKPITVPEFFLRTAEKAPDAKALCWKDNKDAPWQSLTYSEYKKLIYNAAKSFLKLGLEPFHTVCILGFNSVEWFASSMGAVFAGGLSAGIYTTNSPDACQFILENSRANVVVVEDQRQLEKILRMRDKLPKLKAIVQYKGELSQDYPNTYSWKKFLEMGKDTADSVIDDIIKKQQPNQCATLVYTSGTTGNPKGVMLSHDNVTWTTQSLCDHLLKDNWVISPEPARTVTYLPLSHIAAIISDLYLPILIVGTTYFAQPDALKGTLGATIKEAEPSFFFGVPRVWEKMKEKIEAMTKGNITPEIKERIKTAMGFAKCSHVYVGAAPVQQETLDFFKGLGMHILELFGMSEVSGPHTVSQKCAWKLGACGKNITAVETKIDNPDKDGNGEICIRGRHVFMGYLGMEEKTKETIDDEGWVHSGDIGRVEDGFLFITGRIKELIITAGGENIPPVYIESCIKRELPFISNVIVVGDKRKYLTCLLTLKSGVDLNTGKATDDLLPEVVEKFKELGSTSAKVSEVLQSEDKPVYKAIQEGIDRYNAKHAISNAQKVQKWKLLDTDFSIPGGELGPTLKLRRPQVLKKYAETIEALYKES